MGTMEGNSRVRMLIWWSVVWHLTVQVKTISSLQQQPQPIQISEKELRRLRAKGLEILPPGNTLSSGTMAGEPTCDELRAMWRYYRRQARAAELTNQIPQFQLEDLFWGLGTPGEPQSFGGIKGRTRSRLRPKGPKPPYGRLLLQKGKSGEEGNRRPMDEIIQMFGSPGSKSPNSDKSEPWMVLSPPIPPSPKTGLERIKEIFRDERIKAAELKPTTETGSREFGKVILSPPSGQDGRVANKPRELMTPFERIRFGQTDELFNVADGSPRRQGGSHLFPIMKRRNGFIALPMLNRQRSSGWSSFSMKSPQPRPSKYEGSMILVGSGGDDGPSPNSHEEDERNYGVETRGLDLMFQNQPLLVDESIPSCSDVEDQFCSINSDCTCQGHGLYRCNGLTGTCQTLSLNGTLSDESGGFWHSDPLTSSQLGNWEDGVEEEGEEKKRKRAVDAKMT